jgi:hypothetical protein
MNKRTTTNGSEAIKRRMAEGRGQGRGARYKPWLMVHDVASKGLATRMKSPLNGRTYHLLSRLETDWLYAFHHLTGLVDVREQFPLDLDETIQIAEDLGISHPANPQTKEVCVMTTDFLLTRVVGLQESEMAVAIKPSADLGSNRVLEKLEIERVYWAARNTTWRILTERELPCALIKNLRWISPHMDLPDSGQYSADQINRIRLAMEPAIKDGSGSLVEITSACDDRLGLKSGAALCVARHLIGTGTWSVDLMIEIDTQKPIRLVSKQSTYEIAA